jgi:hypothetical protein
VWWLAEQPFLMASPLNQSYVIKPTAIISSWRNRDVTL